MKTKLAVILLALGCFVLVAQSPLLRNAVTTNALPNAVGTLTNNGTGGIGFSTNLQDVTVNNITVLTNLFFVSGKGNTLVVTQQLTLQFIKTNLLATDASGLVTTTKFGAGLSWDPATQTLTGTPATGTPGFTIASNYYVTLNQTNIDNGAAGTNAFIIVGGSGSGVTNGNNLLSAYTAAKAKTPNGAALSLNNRFTIFLAPGLFDLGSQTLTLDAQFVDIIGLSPNTGSTASSATPNLGDTIIKSSDHTIDLNVTPNDITIANFCAQTTGSTKFAFRFDSTETPGAEWKAINIYFKGAAQDQGMAWGSGINYGGYWQDCRCWEGSAFGGAFNNGGNATGTFIRCKAANFSFGQAASGTFIDCEADNGFGATPASSGTCSGTFLRCREVVTTPFGGTFGIIQGTFTGIALDCYQSTSSAKGLNYSSGVVVNSVWNGVNENRGLTAAFRQQSGTGTGTNTVGGNIKTTFVQVGNVGAGEDTLMTNTIAASTLASNGDYLEARCSGSCAVNGNTKNIKVYLGTNQIFTTGALVLTNDWVINVQMIRSNATTVICNADWEARNVLLTSFATNTTAILTLSSASGFGLTGEATSNDDVVQKSMTLKWMPSN